MFRTSLASAIGLACVFAVATSTGCGGGGGGGGGNGSSGGFLTPKVTSVSPVDQTTDISIHSTQIEVTFSENMDASTVNAANFFVEENAVSGAHTVAGTVAYDPALQKATWTLTESGLNPSKPGAVFAFDTVYTIHLTQGLHAGGLPIVPAVDSSFKTAATEFGIVAAGTDPQNAATDVLIDPYRALVNGSLAYITLKVQIDVAVDGTTVTTANVKLKEGGLAGTDVPLLLAFDPTSNTIFCTPDPASNPNPAFAGEPLLKTATSYALVLGTGLKSAASAGGAHPLNPINLGFTTIACGIRGPEIINSSLPTPPSFIDLQVNEIFSAPANSGVANLDSDSNGDGFSSQVSDEFIEVVNVSSDYMDLSQMAMRDSAGGSMGATSVFDFTTLGAGNKHQALLAPGCAVVMWDGIEAGRSIPASKLLIGHSKAFAGTLNGSATPIWNNSASAGAGSPSDFAILLYKSLGPQGIVMNVPIPVPPASSNPASLQRSPEITGGFANHTGVSGSIGRFSPGLKANGAVFR